MSTLLLTTLTLWTAAAGAGPELTFESQADSIVLRVGDEPLATYVLRDPKILRPYFASVHAPGGAQVTRNFPPIPGSDATDHDTMHPGLWMAFGDISGADFWRNKATVRHLEFSEPPHATADGGRFVVRNRYEADGKTLCEETCRISVHIQGQRYAIVWDSRFQADREFRFGDQEEMGLGIRLATPLAVKNGGEIVNSDGLHNEKQVWGKAADWLSYRGKLDGKTTGVMLVPDPANFRRSWFHARDYGFVAANPFGQQAFTRGEPSTIVVRPGESLRLRFAVLIFAGTQISDAETYRAGLDLLKADSD